MLKANYIGVFDKCWHSRRSIGNSSKGIHVVNNYREDILQTHLCILNKTNEVLWYLVAHKVFVKERNLR